MKFLAVRLIAATLMFPMFVHAHGGRTNSEGCHNDRKSGGYHCHGGVPTRKSAEPHKSQTEESACGGKYLCKEMDSCDEAKHYLNDCGLSRLDRDNDGIPCESICGN